MDVCGSVEEGIRGTEREETGSIYQVPVGRVVAKGKLSRSASEGLEIDFHGCRNRSRAGREHQTCLKLAHDGSLNERKERKFDNRIFWEADSRALKVNKESEDKCGIVWNMFDLSVTEGERRSVSWI